jgi:hypothetical protein
MFLHIGIRRDILKGNKKNKLEESKKMKLKTISLATGTLMMVLAFAAPVQAVDFPPGQLEIGISIGNKWISFPDYYDVTFTGDPLSDTVYIAADKANLYDMVKRTYGTTSFEVTILTGSGPQVTLENFSRIKGPPDKRPLIVYVYVPVACPEQLKLTIILTAPT